MFQMSLFIAVLFQLLLGDPSDIPKPDIKYNPSSKFWVYPKGLLPGIPLIRSPNNFSWLLWMKKEQRLYQAHPPDIQTPHFISAEPDCLHL